SQPHLPPLHDALPICSVAAAVSWRVPSALTKSASLGLLPARIPVAPSHRREEPARVHERRVPSDREPAERVQAGLVHARGARPRSEEHTSELQSRENL